MSREENKKAIIEVVFWWVALVILHAVTILLKLLYVRTHGGAPDLIKQSRGIFYMLFANNLFNAFVITLINNKVLKRFMKRFN